MKSSEAFERALRFAHDVASHYEQSPARYANDARHLLEKTGAMPDILNSLNYLGQTELVNAVVGHYQLEARRARLLEPSERARARMCPGIVST